MIQLADYATIIPDWDKDGKKKILKNTLKNIGELQYQMFGEEKSSLLIVLQGMDASGKDGLIRKLFKYCNPVSIAVKSYKKPTPEEYAHDFLWRVHQHAPKKGWVQVFIRSHYEDILVPTVEGFLPKELVDKRYDIINQFEQLLAHNGTRILKFYLHVSPEEQEKRLRERLTVKEKHWKHNDGDWETRKKFDNYMKVYESILDKCDVIPWHIVPSDNNTQKLSVVAEAVLKELESMNLKWPGLQTEFTDIIKPG
ncbi:MAG: PPK2 family polyphosphate kinase [Bacteroidales bacterium]|jgi:PPK2 family polyphosphate:nucleotide phosphotransferase|nr:PPK2 family polyphosphate kinase [Bacteroidales bacterium]